MIALKTSRELAAMKEACQLSAQALAYGGSLVAPGITTREIDHEIKRFIEKHGARPSFLGYGGFPGSACISINNEVIHGIPGDRKVLAGDIVSIDVGAYYRGFHGDNAGTYGAGTVSAEAQLLMDTTRESLYKAIEAAVPGARMGDVSHAVQSLVEARGFAVVTDFVGHGVGEQLHEDPAVPNFGTPGRGVRLVEGMTLAIEPMVNVKGAAVRTLQDGWTVVTKSGCLSAHFEHTIAITKSGPVILTKA